MTPALRESLLASGAELDPGSSRPAHFGDAAAELRDALGRCVVCDRSDLGRVLGRGPDLLDLLNRLSTGAVRDLAPGHGIATVLTSNKGRIVERLFVHHLGETGVLLVAGPGSAPRVIDHLGRFTFAERTDLEDATAGWCQLSLLGPRAAQALERAGLPSPGPGEALGADVAPGSVHLLGQNGLALSGASVLAPAEAAPEVWRVLADAVTALGGRPAGDVAVEAWRVLQGLGAPGHELTEDHNPLEAGLRDAVDFDKGCYVGQEVVARLNTYDKVARAVRGFVLPEGAAAPAPGTPIRAESRAVGEVTSALVPPGRKRAVALGYVKRGFDEAGTPLRIGERDDVVVVVPPFGETP